VFAFQFIGDTLFAGTTGGLVRWRGDDWERVATVPQVSVFSIERGADGAWYLSADSQGIFTSADGGNTWTQVPGLDGELVAGVAELDPNTIVAGTSGDGAFLTRDDGATWHALDIFRGQYVSLLQIDPRDGHTLYLRTRGGLFRSTDSGVTWPAVVGGIEKALVNALLFDSGSHRLYAATDSHGVLVSYDGGATWSSAGTGLPPGTPICALAQIDAQTIAAGAQNGLYPSRDSGTTWQAANSGLGAPQIHAVELDARTGTLFAATEDGLFRLTTTPGPADPNGGFARIGGETLHLPVLSIAIAPSNPQVMYAGTYRRGVFGSRDGGISWASVGDIFHDRLIVPGVAVDPRDDQNVFARVLFERNYKSSDGGATWHAVWTGMPVEAQVGTVSFAPGDPTQMFAGTNIGLYTSTDSGESWTLTGLADQTVFAIWLDPGNPRARLVGATDGLYRSEDGGTTWTRIALPHVTVTAIARDPSGNFYVGAKYNGAWTSRDSGKTWLPLGLDAESIAALIADPARGVLYAVTAHGLYKYSLQP
jgi:photosystem II stability/assembly factor-like uncharacterized protein